MKKWFLRIGMAFVLALAGLAVIVIWTDSDTTVAVRFVNNEDLPTIKPGWPGTPVDQKGRFANHEFPFLPKISGVLKWTLDGNPRKQEKKNDTERLEVRDPTGFLSSNTDGILWLGHASFLIRLSGVNILFDPIFGKPPLVKEYVSVASPLDKLQKVDYVLLSHDHRDHCDADTLKQIAQKFPKAVFLSGLGMEDILNGWKTETNHVQTAGWFQQFDLPEQNVKIFFLPVRHWSRRGLFDLNNRLWGGFVIQTDTVTIYFDGDSGYGRHYTETGEMFPNIDYFLIGIGGFEPRWFMEPHHNSPDDALKAFQDSGAKVLVPMHFGRFDLSDEPPSEPLKLLLQKADEMNLRDRIRALNINESIDLK